MQEIEIRASSIAAMVDCTLRGASLALGLVKPLPSTAPACIGSACHESTAAFDKAKLDGSPISIDDAAGVAEAYIKHPPQDVDWGRVSKAEALERALGVHMMYCADIAPKILYQAVEMPLDKLKVRFPDIGIVIVLTGTLDRIFHYWEPITELIDRATHFGVLDIKSGARACSQATGRHKAQLGTYELLAENTLGKEITSPALIGALQTSADYKTEVKIVQGSKLALLGDHENTGILEHLAGQLKSGDFIGNPSSWLCSPLYCALWKGCIYR